MTTELDIVAIAAEEGISARFAAVEEKLSLSDRFGLWLSFYVFKQEFYLEIV